MYIPRPAKLLFQIDDGWGQLLAKRGDTLPEWTQLVIERMLACGTPAVGSRRYCCASPHCSHTKYICHSCKSRGCSACVMKASYEHIRDYREWCQFLEVQFQRRWKLHFAKKTKHARQNVNYLGRYLKRPPMAASALRHYTGGAVVHHYYVPPHAAAPRQVLSQEEMLLRYISHIPCRHFKMVRYYGFMPNRKCGDLLPKVYTALETEMKSKPAKPGYASLMKKIYECESVPVRDLAQRSWTRC